MTPVVYGAALAWGLSQIAKVLFGLARVGLSDINRVTWRLIWAGGMPSSHSAFAVSTVVLVGLTEGTSHAVFGVAFVFAAVVLYDRAKLYHIYEVLQQRFPALSEAAAADPVLRDLVGHTPMQVLVGTIIGALSGLATWWWMR